MVTSGFEPECVNCGVKLSKGATHCNVCGAPMQTKHQLRRCPDCGTPAAQQAQTCLMCDAPLDREPTGGSRLEVPWIWVGAVAGLLVALVIVGWNYWPNQNQPAAVVPPATLGPTRTSIRLPTTTASPTPALSPTPSPVPSSTPIIHEIQSGETVIYIASYYGTSPDAIMEANNLDETSVRFLRPGQELVIPSTGPVGGPGPGSAAQSITVIHEVESGETLISIAIDYETSVAAIQAMNDLDSPDLIYEGQQLLVPLMPPSPIATAAPSPTPSSTPGPPYPAPHLLSPPDEAEFESADAMILLSWTSIGILRDDQAYLVELETRALEEPVTHTTQGTSWRLPSDLWPTSRLRTLTWRVTVVQQNSPSSTEPAEWESVSLPSETRHFTWR